MSLRICIPSSSSFILSSIHIILMHSHMCHEQRIRLTCDFVSPVLPWYDFHAYLASHTRMWVSSTLFMYTTWVLTSTALLPTGHLWQQADLWLPCPYLFIFPCRPLSECFPLGKHNSFVLQLAWMCEWVYLAPCHIQETKSHRRQSNKLKTCPLPHLPPPNIAMLFLCFFCTMVAKIPQVYRKKKFQRLVFIILHSAINSKPTVKD